MNKQSLSTYQIILGSKSPRRQMLLRGLDIDFRVELRPVQERYPADMAPEQVPEYLSSLKAAAFHPASLPADTILITADTIVLHRGEILTKPRSADHARSILQRLSGDHHTVITGITLSAADHQHSFSESSEVFFRSIHPADIDYYVEKYKPMDKAGAYGIQEWIGYVAIEKIKGSFYNVMGLPTRLLYEELHRFIGK